MPCDITSVHEPAVASAPGVLSATGKDRGAPVYRLSGNGAAPKFSDDGVPDVPGLRRLRSGEVRHVDLVLEAASPNALKSIALDILGSGTDLMAMSVGALMDADFRHDVYNTAREHNANVYVPTGAIVGIDGIKAAAMGEICEARLTTRKSPRSLGRVVEEEEILFEGKASDAVKEFPVNINVAAALSIACHRDIDVKIIVDPRVDRNQHEVYVRGEFGEFKTCSMNLPSKANPKTSQMAAYSAIRLLESFGDNFHIGT